MILILLVILVVILFSIIEINITQEMTINFALFQIGPFPMFYFVVGALIVGALCMMPSILRYYYAYKRVLSELRKREKAEIQFDKEGNPLNFD